MIGKADAVQLFLDGALYHEFRVGVTVTGKSAVHVCIPKHRVSSLVVHITGIRYSYYRKKRKRISIGIPKKQRIQAIFARLFQQKKEIVFTEKQFLIHIIQKKEQLF